MSTGHKLVLLGFVLNKDGKRVVRDARRQSVSARLKVKDKRRWQASAKDWQRPMTRANGRT